MKENRYSQHKQPTRECEFQKNHFIMWRTSLAILVGFVKLQCWFLMKNQNFPMTVHYQAVASQEGQVTIFMEIVNIL